MDEAELLGRAKAGSREAFERLVGGHVPMLFAYSRAVCGDYHQALDVVQQTLLIAYRKLNLFFPEADFSVWLRAIARREGLDARRRSSRAPLVTLETIESVCESPSPEEESPRRRALEDCLGSLGGKTVRLVRSHYFEGRDLSSLSSALGMSLAAAKQLLYRTRLALRDCIRKRLASEGAP
jgi:RNA polymerase sigma-70 factor (ECF subfamily)